MERGMKSDILSISTKRKNGIERNNSSGISACMGPIPETVEQKQATGVFFNKEIAAKAYRDALLAQINNKKEAKAREKEQDKFYTGLQFESFTKSSEKPKSIAPSTENEQPQYREQLPPNYQQNEQLPPPEYSQGPPPNYQPNEQVPPPEYSQIPHPEDSQAPPPNYQAYEAMQDPHVPSQGMEMPPQNYQAMNPGEDIPAQYREAPQVSETAQNKGIPLSSYPGNYGGETQEELEKREKIRIAEGKRALREALQNQIREEKARKQLEKQERMGYVKGQ